MTNIHYIDNSVDIYTYFDPKTMEQICQVRRTKDKRISQWTLNKGQWIPKGPKGHPKPIYNVPDLLSKPTASILLVEGEKTCDAAKILFPDMVCLTWFGGANSASKADLTVFFEKKVYLWPDNDDAGRKAMNEMAQRLVNGVASQVLMVDIADSGLPLKWDLADPYTLPYPIQAFIDTAIEIPILKESEKADFPVMSKKGYPVCHQDNTEYLLNLIKVKIAYNLMTNKIQYSGMSKETKGKSQKAVIYRSFIKSMCSLHHVPKIDLRDHLSAIAQKKSFHPVREWVDSKPWDGVTRFMTLVDTIKTPYELFPALLRRWMVGCIQVVYNDVPAALSGVLIFQGKQGDGKTSWFRKLCPKEFRKDGITLDVTNTDSVRKATCRWLIELGEIESTYRKDMPALKAFITQDEDTYRVPYAEEVEEVPRRTAFFGSVNGQNFLADETGNRRWWTIPIESINYTHDVDMQQVWAEIKVAWLNGEVFHLNKDEQAILDEHNEQFEGVDPLLERILTEFNLDAPRKTFKTSTQIAIEMGIRNPTKSDVTKIGRALKSLNVEFKRDWRNGARMYLMPDIVGAKAF